MGIISFRLDIASSYVYVQEISEMIGEAYLNIWNEKSFAQFNKSYLALNESEKDAVKRLVPVRVTTGEPKLNKETNELVFIK